MTDNRKLFLNYIAQTSPSPMGLEFEHAKGIYLLDKSNKAYIDLISGFAVNNIGHGNPDVIEAITVQTKNYMHLMVYGEVIQAPQVQYAKALTEHLPKNLDTVYFTNSGAEATEGAMKLAKRFTGRSKFFHFKNSYHGSTQGALSMMGDEYFKSAYRPLLPDVFMLEYNNMDSLDKIDENTAAVFIEPVQAESGVTVPDTDFMKKLESICRNNKALLVIDEAQTGFGRTGKLWAFEHYDIKPDILLLAKALGGGMPLGAFVSSSEIMRTLTHDPVLGHITTFGGHPVSCAAGMAAFNYLLQSNLIAEVERKGQLFEQKLKQKSIKQLHRKGLMMALRFHSEKDNKSVIHHAIKNGMVTDWFLFAADCLRICPPLIITDEEIEICCAALLKSIDEALQG